jgi:hypothetical protein
LLALVAALFLAAAPALAAGDKPATDKTDDAKKDDAKKDDAKKDGDAGKDKDKDKAAAGDHEDPLDPFEDPAKTYRFIGIRFRDAVAPKFIINWFANGGRDVNVPMVGPEFITRQNHLEIAIALMYADYSMDPFLFQAKTDGPTTWNLVASQLKLGYAMIDILYEIPLEKKGEKTGRVALLIGGGVGIAGVFGTLYRSNAYPNNPAAANNTGDPTGWSPCMGFGQGSNNPSAAGNYCSSSTHISPSGKVTGAGSYTEPYWTNGGSLPIIFPWIALPQVSFRYKPIKQFQVKVDGGFSTTGFFFGASASYGL